jgi:hypothetical protein
MKLSARLPPTRRQFDKKEKFRNLITCTRAAALNYCHKGQQKWRLLFQTFASSDDEKNFEDNHSIGTNNDI